MMAIRVQTASHSSMECEVMMSELPPASSLRMACHVCRLASTSIPLVGSSIRTSRGRPRRETAAHTFRFVPPLNCEHRVDECPSSPKVESARSMACSWRERGQHGAKNYSECVPYNPTSPVAGPGFTPLMRQYARKVSRTVSIPSRLFSCGQYPVRVPLLSSKPPLVGDSSPVSILNVVLFPAPFSPNNPKHCKDGD